MILIILVSMRLVYQRSNLNSKNGPSMLRITLCAFLTLASSPVFAQHAHHSSNGPTETGQSAFAAIAEIVQLLDDDPKTDWTKVNIGALQSHLVDMDLVTTRAKAASETSGMTVAFTISGDGDAVGAIQRMTTAHAPMLAAETGWDIDTEPTASGAHMRITVTSETELARVIGLGFFGAMTLGAHHQAHHLQIALGDDPHH